MTHANGEPASAATGHAPPLVAVLAGAFLVLCTMVPLALIARSAWSARRALRGCPVCGDSGVRDGGSEGLGLLDMWVSLQCGQCGVWRRLIVKRTVEQAHARRLERDRRRIRARMGRLEAERRALDMRAFIMLLRSQIVGAEDFLAVTRPPASARRPHHPKGRGDR